MARTQAATRIQSAYRGHLTRVHLRRVHLRRVDLSNSIFDKCGLVIGSLALTSDRANIRLVNKSVAQQIPINTHILQAITEEIRDGRVNTVRSALARNPSLHLLPNADTLAKKLSTDVDHFVRSALTENPSLHLLPNAGTLGTTLSSDQDSRIRSALARNPSLHLLPNAGTLATTLSSDPQRRVRLALDGNPRV